MPWRGFPTTLINETQRVLGCVAVESEQQTGLPLHDCSTIILYGHVDSRHFSFRVRQLNEFLLCPCACSHTCPATSALHFCGKHFWEYPPFDAILNLKLLLNFSFYLYLATIMYSFFGINFLCSNALWFLSPDWTQTGVL